MVLPLSFPSAALFPLRRSLSPPPLLFPLSMSVYCWRSSLLPIKQLSCTVRPYLLANAGYLTNSLAGWTARRRCRQCTGRSAAHVLAHCLGRDVTDVMPSISLIGAYTKVYKYWVSAKSTHMESTGACNRRLLEGARTNASLSQPRPVRCQSGPIAMVWALSRVLASSSRADVFPQHGRKPVGHLLPDAASVMWALSRPFLSPERVCI